MPSSKDTRILLRRIRNLCEDGIACRVATEFEHVGLERRDRHIDVASTQGVDAGSSIHRILVLGHLNGSIQSIFAHLVAAKVVRVQPVCLTRLARDHSDASTVWACECV